VAGIRVSPKYGVNPAIPHCWVCSEAKNEVILAGRLNNDAEAPRGAVWDKVPCDRCKKVMETGIFMIECRDGEEGDNPYRTGRLWALTEEAFKRIFQGMARDESLKKRVCFIEESTAKAIGLHDHIPENPEDTLDGIAGR